MQKRELIWEKTLSQDSNRNHGSDSWTCSLPVLWDSTAHFSKAQKLWPKAKICWVAFNCNMPLYMHTQADADHHQGVKRRAENIYEGEKIFKKFPDAELCRCGWKLNSEWMRFGGWRRQGRSCSDPGHRAENSSAVVIGSQRILGFIFDIQENSCPFTLT